MATSVIQGGPGFPVLLPAVYDYICGKKDFTQQLSDVPETIVRNLLHRVSSLRVTCHITVSITSCVHNLLFQLDEADSDESLRELFGHDDMATLLLETGFRKPLQLLVVNDKQDIAKIIRANVILKVKPELDQFCDGLRTCGVLDAISRHPAL